MATTTTALPKRSELPCEERWDTASPFATAAGWGEADAALYARRPDRAAYPGDHGPPGERLAAQRRVPGAPAPLPAAHGSPAQPLGLSAPSPAAALDSYQFGRSQPDFSPNTAPNAASVSYVGEVRSGRPAWRSSLG